MSQFPHDDFAKAYLIELLKHIGTVNANAPFKSETRTADLWLELDPQLAAQRSQLGLLGELLTGNALIEVFRNPATPIEIRACQGKLCSREWELLRQAKRNDISLAEAELPYLWLLMPTASQAIRQGFGLVPTTVPGVYQFPSLQRIGVVVIHQLPKTPDTLWLRVLGRAGEQQSAIAEFTQQPAVSPLHASIEELLADYRAGLEAQRSLTSEEEELVMNLSAAYLKKQQEWKQEGAQAKQQEIAVNLLRAGIAMDTIAQVTGLSLEQIHHLRESL